MGKLTGKIKTPNEELKHSRDFWEGLAIQINYGRLQEKVDKHSAKKRVASETVVALMQHREYIHSKIFEALDPNEPKN